MEATFMVQSLCPDVCKSPVVPVPYPIVAYLDKSVMVSPNVRSNGVPVFHMGSRVATVIGDEAGVGGGVTSMVNLGFCKPIVPVPSVRINGQPANDSEITYMLMNGASPEGPFNTIGQLKYLPPMYFADVGPGGTVPPGDPGVAAETDAEGGFLGKLTDMAGKASVSDVVSMSKTAYGLATTDWSNPAAVLGAIGGVAGIAQMGGLAKAAQLAQKGRVKGAFKVNKSLFCQGFFSLFQKVLTGNVLIFRKGLGSDLGDFH